MTYFTQDYIDFFKDLTRNNNREWFQENKKRYTKNVRGAFVDFVDALINALEEEWGAIPFSAKDFMMRINRDIRFSKDKTPYNDHLGAMISPHGKRNMTRPGIFIRANHNEIQVYTGCYLLEKEDLMNVRMKIAENMSDFQKLKSDKSFVSIYGEILGDKHKRLPKELKEAAESEPLIFNKGFYYGFHLPSEWLLSDDLVKEIVKKFKVAIPMNTFLDEALTS